MADISWYRKETIYIPSATTRHVTRITRHSPDGLTGPAVTRGNVALRYQPAGLRQEKDEKLPPSATPATPTLNRLRKANTSKPSTPTTPTLNRLHTGKILKTWMEDKLKGSSSTPSATSSGTSAATSRESQPRPGIVSRQKASFSPASTTNSNGLMSRPKNNNLAASTTHLPSATSTLTETSKSKFSASTQSLASPRSKANHMGGSTQSLALPNGSHCILEEQDCMEKQEVEVLKNEVAMLRKELKRCRETIGKMQEREKQMKDRLSEHALKHLEAGSKFENLNLGDNRPTQLIQRYGNLYSETRVEAFDALDDLPEMAEFDDLKGKLLFSVVVLAFRSVQHSVRQLRARVRHILYLPDPRSPLTPEPISREMEDTITVYLKKTVDKYDLSTNVNEVSQQVWATLFDYPSLKSCRGLKVYIEECVTLAWANTVQVPPLTIHYECRIFDPDIHTRFHTSNPDSDQIRSVLWPALVEQDSGACVAKAVVAT